MKSHGELTISKVHGAKSGSKIRLRIEDEDSGATVEVCLGLADFAEALTGLACIPVGMETRNLDKWGLRRESKQFIEPSGLTKEDSESIKARFLSEHPEYETAYVHRNNRLQWVIDAVRWVEKIDKQ